MKKSLIFLGLLALTLVVAGCSQFGDTGNPTELTGTWTASDAYSSAASGTVAGSTEGTWTFDYTSNPTPTQTVVSGTITTYTWYNPTTTVYSGTRVVKADGSYTDTLTYKLITPDRAAAPANTATTFYNGATGAFAAGTLTTVTTKTVTLTPNADGSYQELVVLKRTTTTTGSYTGTTYNDYTQTSTSQVGSGTFQGSAQFYNGNTTDYNCPFSNFKQTVGSAQYGASTDTTTAVAYTLVIDAAGTYTWTTVTTTTTSKPSAGTSKYTQVITGTVAGANDSSKVVTFSKTSQSDSYVGTGSLISGAYPATEYTYKQASVTGTTTYNYYVTKGKSKTYLQMYRDKITTSGTNVSGGTMSLPQYSK